MDLDALYPAGGNHAIQNVAFVIEWQAPLSEADYAELRKVHQEHLRQALPIIETPQVITFNIQPGLAPAMVPQVASGLSLARHRPTATGTVVSCSIQINPQNCLIVVNDYTRWDEIWTNVTEWTNYLLPVILKKERALGGMALQYADGFEWRGNPSEFKAEVLFSPETSYLPSNVFGKSGLWHSHHGFFTDVEIDAGYTQLDNVNVNLGDDPASLRRTVSIVTSHKVTFVQPVWGVEQATAKFQGLMGRLHDSNKAVLKDLLLDAVQEKIKLFGDGKAK
ncbi:TIGR04255 family protein [Paraburkholderia nemoris]|uniref:TIGR04255 family protein n=1 Tax=Paraburkholderia nemoris TaxID=2793076 RepID=UPI0038BA5574